MKGQDRRSILVAQPGIDTSGLLYVQQQQYYCSSLLRGTRYVDNGGRCVLNTDRTATTYLTAVHIEGMCVLYFHASPIFALRSLLFIFPNLPRCCSENRDVKRSRQQIRCPPLTFKSCHTINVFQCFSTKGKQRGKSGGKH